MNSETRSHVEAAAQFFDCYGDEYHPRERAKAIRAMCALNERLERELAESRKMCGTLSELHAKGEMDNVVLRAELGDALSAADVEARLFDSANAALKAEAAHARGEREYMPMSDEYVMELHRLRAENAALKVELDRKAYMLRMGSMDWAEDDTRIRELAKPFGIDMEGDSYFVPTMVDVVEHMAEMLAEARKLAGTMSELHAKGELENSALTAAIEVVQERELKTANDNARLRAALIRSQAILGNYCEHEAVLDCMNKNEDAIAGTPAPEKKEQP